MLDEHIFDATIGVDAGAAAGYLQHFVAIPPAVADALRAAGAARFVGELVAVEHGGALVPFRRVLHRRQDGIYCLRFGREWLRSAGLAAGDLVAVSLRPDPAPDAIDVPEELDAALAASGPAQRQWARLTPGRRRSFAYAIERIRSPESRARRAEVLVERLAADAEEGRPTQLVSRKR